MSGMDFEAFFDAYVECALWASTDCDTDTSLDQLDAPLTRKALAEMRRDCRAFAKTYAAVLAGREVQAGHDFWLTRNGHGAGFWDRGNFWPNEGKELTDAAQAYGSCDLYVHRGRVHVA